MNKKLQNYLEEKKENIKRSLNNISIDFASDYSIKNNNNYLTDLFCEYADGRVDIYTKDLIEWFAENYEEVEEAIDEFGEPKTDGRFDMLKAIMQGQYLYYERQLFEDKKEIVELMIINYLLENEEEIEKPLKEETVEKMIEEAVDEFEFDDDLEVVFDVVTKYIKKEENDD